MRVVLPPWIFVAPEDGVTAAHLDGHPTIDLVTVSSKSVTFYHPAALNFKNHPLNGMKKFAVTEAGGIIGYRDLQVMIYYEELAMKMFQGVTAALGKERCWHAAEKKTTDKMIALAENMAAGIVARYLEEVFGATRDDKSKG